VRRRAEALLIGVPGNAFLMASLGVANVGQVLSLAALPFSRPAFRRANRFLANVWQGLCVKSAEKLYGFEVIFTGDDVPPAENALLVVNHQQMPDIPVLWWYAQRKQRGGDIRFFVKESLKHVPGIGWGLQLVGNVFVKRNWAADRDTIARTFAAFARERLPLWLVLFAEGTRVTAAKLARHHAIAAEKGVPPLRHLLWPRSKGFIACLRGLRERLDAVYDMTIGYEGGVPDIMQYMKGYARRVHLHVRRFPIAELPEDDDALAAWLVNVFRDKDDLLEHYYSHGHFPATGAPARGAAAGNRRP
jgi:1-acyl-sn-glycerol-3-phosphate acyltransferase